MTPKPIIHGESMHCHHKWLFEYCYDYQERVDYIKANKPVNERKIRLKRFKILTKKEIAMFPAEYIEASQKRTEASQKLKEADQKRREAYQKWEEAYHKYKPQLEEIHKKICNCKEWNGEEMIFQ